MDYESHAEWRASSDDPKVDAEAALLKLRDAVARARVVQKGAEVTMSAQDWNAIADDRNFKAVA